MFSSREFELLYKILDLDMVDTDCGVRCNKFCCIDDGINDEDRAFKYLLPGEAEFLVSHGFHNHALLEDFGFLIHYRSIRPGVCACERIRTHRPFCCRMCPFRPVIDLSKNAVVDVVKTKNPIFAPCWIEQSLSEWRLRAVEAWNYIFSDRDYLEFYAKYYLCLKKSEDSNLSFAQAMREDEAFSNQIRSLPFKSFQELFSLCRDFFDKV
jgi:hypothetical protein